MNPVKNSPLNKYHPLSCFFIFFFCQTLLAKEFEDLTFFDADIPVVLSATRLAQPQTEAPASITIIDRAMIKLSGAKAIPELFRLVPGMHVGYFRGNKPVVSYQGLSSEYPQGVQVLIDGRSVYSPLFGGVDWSNIPLVLEDIERIEIIRGANGSSFGSNAFQAVINITTSHAVQTDGLQVKSTLGERGYQRTLFRGGFSFGDLDIRLTGSHLDDNGYANNDDDSRQDLLTGRVDYQITSQDNLQLNFGVVNTLKETHTPGTLLDPFDPPRHIDESNHSLHARWEHSTMDNQLFITQASYTRHLSKDKFSSFYDAAGLGIGLLGNTVSQLDYTGYYDRYDIEFEHQRHLNEQVRLSWGLGLRNDRVYLPGQLPSEKKFNHSLQRLFSNVEWRPTDKLIINAGALWEHSQLSGESLSPRLALNYLLTPTQSLRASALHAVRSPVIVEDKMLADIPLESITTPGLVLTQPFLRSQSGLDPETVDSIEFGYHGLFIDNALTLDIKLFRNEYDKLIDTTSQNTPASLTLFGAPLGNVNLGLDLHTIDNLFYANVNGYEIEINYRPDKNNMIHIGYAYNHTNVGHVSNNSLKNLLFSVPTDVFNILASHTFKNKIWSSVAFYYTGSMEYLNSGNPQGPMRRLDFNAGKTVNLSPHQELELSFHLQLALDKNTDFLREFNLDNRAFFEISYAYN